MKDFSQINYQTVSIPFKDKVNVLAFFRVGIWYISSFATIKLNNQKTFIDELCERNSIKTPFTASVVKFGKKYSPKNELIFKLGETLF